VQLEADTKQVEVEAATVQAESEAGPSVPTEMERADPEEKSTEQIATEKLEAPGPEASNKSIDYIICHASGKVLSQEMLKAQHYAQKLKYPNGALVFTLQETHKFSWAGIFSSAGPRKYGSYFRQPRDRRKCGVFLWAGEYFRWKAHENTKVIFVGLLTDKNVAYFLGLGPCRRK
jgi:hypothetical protein